MTLEVRRIVTGHDEFGKGIVVSDEKMKAASRGLGPHISGCEIWSTNSMPAMFPHRTETMDYSIVLSGEIDVEFDSGEVVTMRQGDVIVMRGVTHNWKNKSTVLAVTAFILIDAAPFEAAGEKRGVLYPA